MESTGINCITGKAPSLAVILSKHMALKQHIKSQLVAFVKGKKLPAVSVWKVLCLHQDSCGALAAELEDWLGKHISDLEASYFLIEIHNALVRFLNGVCNKGFATCKGIELIMINALQMLHSVAKIRRSIAKITIMSDSGADITGNGFGQCRVKRWIFTGFLSTVRGLADEEEIRKLEKTAENLRHVELNNAGEIVKLESNKIVERISKQNERLTQLFDDEQGLKLQDIMSKDASISRQLSAMVRSLEVVADINLEYSVLSSIIELIPVLLTEC
jgi:hypothetical protein